MKTFRAINSKVLLSSIIVGFGLIIGSTCFPDLIINTFWKSSWVLVVIYADVVLSFIAILRACMSLVDALNQVDALKVSLCPTGRNTWRTFF